MSTDPDQTPGWKANAVGAPVADYPNPCLSTVRAFLGFPEGGVLVPCGGRAGHEGRHQFFIAWTDAGAHDPTADPT